MSNNTLWYVASPFSKYPDGIEEAFKVVARETARLVKRKIPVFSPITHTYPIALYGEMDQLDHTIWLPCDEPMMRACTGIIMLRMESWEKSYGMQVEYDTFVASGKPVVWMIPGEVPEEFLPGGKFHHAETTEEDRIQAMGENYRDEADRFFDELERLSERERLGREVIEAAKRFSTCQDGDRLIAEHDLNNAVAALTAAEVEP